MKERSPFVFYDEISPKNTDEFALGKWDAENPEILAVAEKFVFANCYNPQVAGQILQQTTEIPPPRDDSQCQVSET
jgi:hypothetical protein